MSIVLLLCGAMLTLAAVLLLGRITAGPTMLDRIIALDVLVAVLICVIGVEAAVNRHTTTLPMLVALALLGFVGSVSVAALSHGSEDLEEERP